MPRDVLPIVLIALLLTGGLAPAEGAAGRITAEHPEHDFGAVASGQTVSHTFRLTNAGDGPLRIERVETACGCTTVASIDGRIIEPGDELTLPVELSLKGRHGAQRKQITVHTDDPQTPAFHLYLVGDAVRVYTADPTIVNVGRVASPDQALGTTVVTAAPGRSLVIERVAPSADYLDVSLTPVIEGEAYELQVRLTDAAGPGLIDESLELQTADPDLPTISIPVRGYLLADVAIAPTSILVAEGTAGATRYITVAPGTIEDFAITAVELPGPEMTATVRAVGRRGYRIRISGIDGDPAWDGRSVVLKTDIPTRPTIEVPIEVAGNPEQAPAEATP